MRVWDTSHLLDDVPGNRTVEHVFDVSDSQASIARIRLHFKQLRTRLILGLLLGFLLPNAILSVYFHAQFASSLKKSAMLNLAAVVENQKNTVDLYLQERVVNLFSLLHSGDFVLQPTPVQMGQYLATLKQFHDGFTDIGLLDAKGVQIGYAGPNPVLLGRDYSQDAWYHALIGGKKNYLITDIYPGLRNIPHFTIAARQLFEGRLYVIRASLDPGKLYMFLRSISHDKDVESTLVNHEGVCQIVDSGRSSFPERSEYLPPFTSTSGQEEIDRNGRSMLVAYSWLGEVQWALLTTQPVSIFQSDVYRARLILTISLIAVSLLISIIIFFTIERLVNNARRMAEKGQQLQEMLAHASKLASIGELAESVAHEINNPLAIIMATSGVIRDMLNPEFDLDHSPEAICKELSVIDTAATRAKGITSRLQEMGKSRVPHAEQCSVNALIEEVLSRLSKVELKSKHIEIIKRYDESLPEIFAEPAHLRQVFANILINAGDAIAEKGTITISTELQGVMVCVTIADTGRGISSQDLPRIFNPFFTSKKGGNGTGLGLSIAASIVKYMGGTIKVNSTVDTGSLFTVLLPVDVRQVKGKK